MSAGLAVLDVAGDLRDGGVYGIFLCNERMGWAVEGGGDSDGVMTQDMRIRWERRPDCTMQVVSEIVKSVCNENGLKRLITVGVFRGSEEVESVWEE